ncbi:SDR family oxidoreductase [Boudabousia tangfeifanii]|uniref:SDR family oxidoreductase n=2 Tax=Boudabousia tangfeifanii TaxID=1912795 RepID=A0A1D9MM99_9ACTO|nr:SDR family oxidoreductase [Boudabousia tangfeifanii]
MRKAVITGASAGIGEACARALAADGWQVVLAARRLELLERIAAEVDGQALFLDVTDDDSVARFAAEVGDCDLLVNNAGGALGLDSVAEADLADWQWMYDTNVLGTLRVTKAFLPALLERNGLVINIGSIAGRVPYVGGAGYNAAKHGVAAMSRVLRLETADQPLRVCEIDPGRVETEFSVNRFKGDRQRAAKVYEGHLNLQAEDVAEAVRWVASLPKHVNIDSMLIMPADQV